MNQYVIKMEMNPKIHEDMNLLYLYLNIILNKMFESICNKNGNESHNS